MKYRKKIIILLPVLIIALIIAFPFIEDGLSCLAYYDQCTASRIEGLSREQCLERSDAVAFLLEEDVCLVRPQK